MTRLKKLLNLAIELEWLVRNPFINYNIKFLKAEREILNKGELSDLENASFHRNCLNITKDMFILSCNTGLSYIDIKQLNHNNRVNGIDGELWIKTKYAKTNIPIKITLFNKAALILKKYKIQENFSNKEEILPIYSNQKTNQIYARVLDDKISHDMKNV